MSKQTSIGGQALIEGLLMLGPDKAAMANRLPDGSIHVESFARDAIPAWRKLPFVRGVFGMFTQLGMSFQYLMKSADLQEEAGSDTEAETSSAAGNLMVVLGLVLGIAIFMVLPNAVVSLFSRGIDTAALTYGQSIGLNLIEGFIRVALLIGYMAVIALQEDIHRTFQYHGAEHKTIACYESGAPLTVENVASCSRFHPRCGTSFLFIVVIVAALLYALAGWHQVWLNVLVRLALIPVIMSLSYELLRFSGRHPHTWYGRLLSAPGLWLQRLTTREPDEGMLEVSISALLPVIPEDPLADQWGSL